MRLNHQNLARVFIRVENMVLFSAILAITNAYTCGSTRRQELDLLDASWGSECILPCARHVKQAINRKMGS
ncbi:hypothetical protein AB1N83_009445 [Pleurotus pulmonarius]